MSDGHGVRPGVTHDDPRRSLLGSLRDLGFGGRVAVAANHRESAQRLEEAGADLVLMPFRDAAVQAALLVLDDDRTGKPQVTDPLGQRGLTA